MSDACERILASVRRSLLRATLPDAEPVGACRVPERGNAPARGDDLAGPFTTALGALTGHVHRAATSAEAVERVAAIFRAHQATTYISWDEDALGCPGVIDGLRSHGLRRVAYDVPSGIEARGRVMASLAAVPVGITGADAALADSGAIVLVSGPGRGRLVSLLPPLHVALVPVGRLRPGLDAVLAERLGLLDDGSNVVAIAGPSRTADIEMTLTHGVHGPKALHVVLIG